MVRIAAYLNVILALGTSASISLRVSSLRFLYRWSVISASPLSRLFGFRNKTGNSCWNFTIATVYNLAIRGTPAGSSSGSDAIPSRWLKNASLFLISEHA